MEKRKADQFVERKFDDPEGDEYVYPITHIQTYFMKKIRSAMLALVVLMLASCQVATEKDYTNAAKDICNCVEKETQMISPSLKKLLTDAYKKPGDFEKNLEAEMGEYVEKHPEKALELVQEAAGMQNLQFDDKKMQACIKSLESKYGNLVSTDSQSKIEEKLMKAIETSGGCEFTAVCIKMAQSQQ